MNLQIPCYVTCTGVCMQIHVYTRNKDINAKIFFPHMPCTKISIVNFDSRSSHFSSGFAHTSMYCISGIVRVLTVLAKHKGILISENYLQCPLLTLPEHTHVFRAHNWSVTVTCTYCYTSLTSITRISICRSSSIRFGLFLDFRLDLCWWCTPFFGQFWLGLVISSSSTCAGGGRGTSRKRLGISSSGSSRGRGSGLFLSINVHGFIFLSGGCGGSVSQSVSGRWWHSNGEGKGWVWSCMHWNFTEMTEIDKINYQQRSRPLMLLWQHHTPHCPQKDGGRLSSDITHSTNLRDKSVPLQQPNSTREYYATAGKAHTSHLW